MITSEVTLEQCVCVCVRFPQIQFEYQDPTANFNRSRVKGPVVRLLRVRERDAATALEVTAGGRVSGERKKEGERERENERERRRERLVCVCVCSCITWWWTRRRRGSSCSRKAISVDDTPSSLSTRSPPGPSQTALSGRLRAW